MPIYEFECQDCEKLFSLTLFSKERQAGETLGAPDGGLVRQNVSKELNPK